MVRGGKGDGNELRGLGGGGEHAIVVEARTGQSVKDERGVKSESDINSLCSDWLN